MNLKTARTNKTCAHRLQVVPFPNQLIPCASAQRYQHQVPL